MHKPYHLCTQFQTCNLLSILANKGLAHYLCRLSIFCKQLLPNLEGKRNQVELVMQSMVLSKVQIDSNDTFYLWNKFGAKCLLKLIFWEMMGVYLFSPLFCIDMFWLDHSFWLMKVIFLVCRYFNWKLVIFSI